MAKLPGYTIADLRAGKTALTATPQSKFVKSVERQIAIADGKKDKGLQWWFAKNGEYWMTLRYGPKIREFEDENGTTGAALLIGKRKSQIAPFYRRVIKDVHAGVFDEVIEAAYKATSRARKKGSS